MKKLLPLSFLLTLTVLFTACGFDKYKTEEVVPTAQADMSRAFSYIYNEPQSADVASYGGTSVETYASLDIDRLNVNFGAVPRYQGTDVINFSISSPQLLAGYVGVYTLKSLPDPGNGAAEVLYSYRKEANSSTMYLSNSSTIQGHFTITAYDAKHRLISGSYEDKLKQAFDPKATQMSQTDIRRCDITIQGTFTNIKITQ